VEWRARGAAFQLDTRYPYQGEIALRVRRADPARPFALALRIPAWAGTHRLQVNGRPAAAAMEKGYAVLRRAWKTGDVVTLALPLPLRLEAAPGNPKVVALLRGPMVMAADLGPASEPWTALAPALVGADILAGFAPLDSRNAVYRTRGTGRPGELRLTPFYAQYRRRSAVYFNAYTDAEWAASGAAYRKEQARLKELAARSVDVMHLGEMQPERDHQLESDISNPVTYRGRNGRDARTGGYFSFRMKAAPGPLVLQATYWGEERNRDFHISIDGVRVARVQLQGEDQGVFIERAYPLPEQLTRGKDSLLVRFEPEPGHSAGPVFGCLLYRDAQH
jgi:hypothetical protein